MTYKNVIKMYKLESVCVEVEKARVCACCMLWNMGLKGSEPFVMNAENLDGFIIWCCRIANQKENYKNLKKEADLLTLQKCSIRENSKTSPSILDNWWKGLYKPDKEETLKILIEVKNYWEWRAKKDEVKTQKIKYS